MATLRRPRFVKLVEGTCCSEWSAWRLVFWRSSDRLPHRSSPGRPRRLRRLWPIPTGPSTAPDSRRSCSRRTGRPDGKRVTRDPALSRRGLGRRGARLGVPHGAAVRGPWPRRRAHPVPPVRRDDDPGRRVRGRLRGVSMGAPRSAGPRPGPGPARRIRSLRGRPSRRAGGHRWMRNHGRPLSDRRARRARPVVARGRCERRRPFQAAAARAGAGRGVFTRRARPPAHAASADRPGRKGHADAARRRPRVLRARDRRRCPVRLARLSGRRPPAHAQPGASGRRFRSRSGRARRRGREAERLSPGALVLP